jgi:hypothetical protein
MAEKVSDKKTASTDGSNKVGDGDGLDEVSQESVDGGSAVAVLAQEQEEKVREVEAQGELGTTSEKPLKRPLAGDEELGSEDRRAKKAKVDVEVIDLTGD